MEFDRHDRMRTLLGENIATFIREEASSNPLITVTNVSVTPNYREVTVFFTTIPNSGEDDALVFLKRKGSELRAYIKKHTRIKVIPFVNFSIDHGERHRQHIDTVVQRIESGTEKK
jgi:ribosome-binding factor A